MRIIKYSINEIFDDKTGNLTSLKLNCVELELPNYSAKVDISQLTQRSYRMLKRYEDRVVSMNIDSGSIEGRAWYKFKPDSEIIPVADEVATPLLSRLNSLYADDVDLDTGEIKFMSNKLSSQSLTDHAVVSSSVDSVTLTPLADSTESLLNISGRKK